jgi:hypothetical protein
LLLFLNSREMYFEDMALCPESVTENGANSAVIAVIIVRAAGNGDHIYDEYFI